jgi:NitT/TauT family transport system substrate-binding protein
MQIIQNRRRFLAGAASVGVAGLLGTTTRAQAEAPPEVTSVRLPAFPNVSDCQAAMYVSEELLRAEGIMDVQFVTSGTGPDSADWIANDELDFDWNFPPAHIRSIANGVPITVLAGMHAGCLELFANDSIRSVKDLKGKRVGVDAIFGVPHMLLVIMTASVGLDPTNDIDWIATPNFNPVEMFAAGKIDAFLAGPPQPQEMRVRKLGHVILNTSLDRPWSQYFCCMLSGTSDFVQRFPVATKRVLRAMLKAVDLCVSDPEQVARAVVEKRFASSYNYALQAMTDARFDKWREYDAEDTIRFYALRMQETGIVKPSPQTIITEGTYWRFLDELKRELKT